MTAIRSVRAAEGKFVQISNIAAQDSRLSLRARGVILLVLSLPPEQHFTAKWLESQVTEGREAIRSALNELERFGYLQRERKHAADGLWTWEQILSDAPAHVAEQPCDGNPSVGEPSDGKPSHKRSNTETLKHEDQKKAPRRAAHSVHGDETDITPILDEVRRAAVRAYGDSAADLTDEQCMHIYSRFCCTKTGQPYKLAADVYAYLAGGPLKDVPTLGQALQPSAKRRIPMAALRRFNDPDTRDDELLEIVESVTGLLGPGEEPAVQNMIMDGRPLSYIVNAVSSGHLNVAA